MGVSCIHKRAAKSSLSSHFTSKPAMVMKPCSWVSGSVCASGILTLTSRTPTNDKIRESVPGTAAAEVFGNAGTSYGRNFNIRNNRIHQPFLEKFLTVCIINKADSARKIKFETLNMMWTILLHCYTVKNIIIIYRNILLYCHNYVKLRY